MKKLPSYAALLQQLFSLPKRGMQTFPFFQQLDQKMGHPHKAFRIVHVGGTNGKGSVATKIAAALQEEGFRVGLYTSPHISSFRERIQINRQMISEGAVREHLSFIFRLMNEPIAKLHDSRKSMILNRLVEDRQCLAGRFDGGLPNGAGEKARA